MSVTNFFFVEKTVKRKEDMLNAYQKAVAAKHMVLPTYIGSRKILKGNLNEKDEMNGFFFFSRIFCPI